MSKIVTPFRVGLLVLAAGATFLIFFAFVRKAGLSSKEASTFWAYFKDASGLGLKSRVQTAGIPVGEISDIRLEGNRARVTLRIRRSVAVKLDAAIAKRSESVLGDNLLDLWPGSEEAAPLADGGQIANVVDKVGLDESFERLNRIASNIQNITDSLRQVLGGEKGAANLQTIIENMVQLSGSLDRTVGEAGEKLDAVLGNFEAFSADIRHLTAGQQQNYEQIVANVRGVTEDVRDVLKVVKQVLGSGEGELKESVASLKQTLGRLDQSLKNVESVTHKIDEGQGPLGRLLNDEALAQNIHATVEDASDYVGRVVRLITEVSLRGEFFLDQGSSKYYLRLRLIPKPDKYYLFEIVDDPHGRTTQSTTMLLPPGPEEVEQQTKIVTEQSLKFSAQFAKRYYFATVRFGIFESTGGVGGNLHFLRDSLSINFDLFDFGALDKDYPRLKVYANYAFLGHLFVTVGIDDVLNPQRYDTDVLSPAAQGLSNHALLSGRDVFVGAGISFTDDDLKAIITSVPLPGL